MSQESSPTSYFDNSPAPTTTMDFNRGAMLVGQVQNSNWGGLGDFSNHGPPQHTMHGIHQQNIPQHSPQSVPQSIPQSMPEHLSAMDTYHGFPNMSMSAPYKPHFTVHPTPLKSRVETQIPIKLTLFPLPPGIKKLHLPTHTISKPKLLCKPPHEKSPDTLELYTSLVCTSAMQRHGRMQAALKRAANPEAVVADAAGSEDDESDEEKNSALNGGEVKICNGCVLRERKRASRKKVKKVEEEEGWLKHEAKRIIVFNTSEVRDWQPPTSQPSTEATGERGEPFVPEGAMQIDAPMRIACYCRHQQEKVGFQVIFTIKDYQGRLIAQTTSSSIMITDDHKTHNMLPFSTQNPIGAEGQMYPGTAFSPEPSFDLSGGGPNGNMAPFRVSRSSSDLQSLQQGYNMQYASANSNSPGISTQPSQTTSATMTPRNLSRQASPTASIGPTSKKRKASGSMSKVPPALAMTKLETEFTAGQSPPSVISATTSAAVSPFSTPNISSFPLPNQQFAPQPPNISNMAYTTASPPTPNRNNTNDQLFFNNNSNCRAQSIEDVGMQPLFSAPASARPSRAPSPNGMRHSIQAYQQQQMTLALQNGLHGVGLSINPQQPPTIHKIIPAEGPKGGGIEVTCLGSGFIQGLEVMFGDSRATTTTYWGETSLVCLLPPAIFAGTVPVTFKHQHQQGMPFYTPPTLKAQALFKYVDDDQAQLIKTALLVLGAKMSGGTEDVGDLARRIIGEGASSWAASGRSHMHPPTGSNQHHNLPGFSAATFGVDVEGTLLKCLDLIDLDDSPRVARLNLRNASRQTMLHMACSLGFDHFVAGLLARGANPEPRDRGGFTPLHFAALHDHPRIVRRLMLVVSDSSIRSVSGYTPSQMASSREVLEALHTLDHHRRTRSSPSLRGRSFSVSSLRSAPRSVSILPLRPRASFSLDSDTDRSDDEDDDTDEAQEDAFVRRSRSELSSAQRLVNESRRSSAHRFAKQEMPDEKEPVLDLPNVGDKERPVSPAAAMVAFRDQLTAQITHFKQTMHLNLPNLPQMPRFDMTMPDYQNYIQTAPMVRRITNLVGNNRPEGANREDYKWWDLFSTPPAYEEIFPQSNAEAKRASAVQAAADTVADNKCAELFDQEESSTMAQTKTEKIKLGTVRIGQSHTITREQQDQLRLAHAEKVERLSRDRNLFFVWVFIPFLFSPSLFSTTQDHY